MRWLKDSILLSVIVLILFIVATGSIVQYQVRQETLELAQDCDDGGGVLVRSFRQEHEVWICISEITLILKD